MIIEKYVKNLKVERKNIITKELLCIVKASVKNVFFFHLTLVTKSSYTGIKA